METGLLSPTGQVIPLHRHRVSLDFLRVQFGVTYHLAEDWKVLLSVPYDIKDQDASTEEIGAVTSDEREAMLANQNIHHRDEVYRGLADADLLVSHRLADVLRYDDRLVASLGTRIPIGTTEADPFKLGDAGQEHLHIQFGTGTFAPLAQLYYVAPLFDAFLLSASVRGQFPFYKNSKTYRGSVEVTGTAEVKYQATDWLALHASYLRLFQSYAYWDGERDINSGLVLRAALFGVTVNPGYGALMRLNVMFPFHRRTLSDEGDVFQHGPTVSMMVSHSL